MSFYHHPTMISWNNLNNMEGVLIKDMEMDETTIPFALEVEVPSSISVTFRKQQQQESTDNQYCHRPYYCEQQQQQQQQQNRNFSTKSISNQPKLIASLSSVPLSATSKQKQYYSSPTHLKKGLEQQQQFCRVTLPKSFQTIQISQQQSHPPSKFSTMSLTTTNKKGKRSKRQQPFIDSSLPTKRIKQEQPPSYSPVIPLFQQHFDEQEPIYNKESVLASPTLPSYKYLKTFPIINKIKHEKSCDIEQVDNRIQSSSSSYSNSNSISNNFSNTDNNNHININNFKIKSISNNSHLISKTPKTEKWGRFFLGKPRKKYIGKKQNRNTLFCIEGETPEENLAYVVVKVEFQEGGMFFYRRAEVLSLIRKQYKKALRDKNINNLQAADDDDDDDDGMKYSNKNTDNNILRMRFPPECSEKRAKEHEYLDLLCLPEFKEFESNPQLWECIDDLFGSKVNESSSCNELTFKQEHY